MNITKEFFESLLKPSLLFTSSGDVAEIVVKSIDADSPVVDCGGGMVKAGHTTITITAELIIDGEIKGD